MSDKPASTPPPLSREERLAVKLRENLRRRKEQARAGAGKVPPSREREGPGEGR